MRLRSPHSKRFLVELRLLSEALRSGMRLQWRRYHSGVVRKDITVAHAGPPRHGGRLRCAIHPSAEQATCVTQAFQELSKLTREAHDTWHVPRSAPIGTGPSEAQVQLNSG